MAITEVRDEFIGWDDYRLNPLWATIDGRTQTIAVLDTGADLDHPIFGPDSDGNGVADRIIYSYNFVGSNSSNANDGHRHGTHVAGIAAGGWSSGVHGIATGAKLVILKVLADDGRGSTGDVFEALTWLSVNAAAYGISVVNMSLGGEDQQYSGPTNDPANDDALLNQLTNLGLTVVTAAGNESAPNSVSDYASDANVLALRSVDYYNTISYLSNRSQEIPMAFAPGEAVESSIPGGGIGSSSGTSQAAPQVSGLVALMQDLAAQMWADAAAMRTFIGGAALNANASPLSPSEIKSIIFKSSSSTPVDDPNLSAERFWSIDVNRALASTLQYMSNDGVLFGGSIVERMMLGWRGDDVMTASEKYFGGSSYDPSYFISSGGGNDIVNGWTQDDVIFAGADNDVVHGREGNDLIEGEKGNDTLHGDGGDDRIGGGDGNDLLYGDDGSDRLNGGDGADVLDGGAGDDLIFGGRGNDTLIGGPGNDTYYVDAAGDVVTEVTAAVATGGYDRIYSSVSYAMPANTEVLVLMGAAVINGTGSNTANYLYGSTGSNVLRALGGNDRVNGAAVNDYISGGIGLDLITGGLGRDYFYLDVAVAAGTNRDYFTDYSAADDTLMIENAIYTALGAATGALAAGKFWSSATGLAHDADDRIIYNTANGNLYYDINGNAAGGSALIAVLQNKPVLTAADIYVI